MMSYNIFTNIKFGLGIGFGFGVGTSLSKHAELLSQSLYNRFSKPPPPSPPPLPPSILQQHNTYKYDRMKS